MEKYSLPILDISELISLQEADTTNLRGAESKKHRKPWKVRKVYMKSLTSYLIYHKSMCLNEIIQKYSKIHIRSIMKV